MASIGEMAQRREVATRNNSATHQACASGYDQRQVVRHLRSNISALRRFVRILVGRQRFADLCIVKLVDDVANAPDRVIYSAAPKIDLFRHLVDIVNDPGTQGASLGSPPVNVCSMARQASLLAGLEGLSPDQIAWGSAQTTLRFCKRSRPWKLTQPNPPKSS
jgi:hypothetical protein